MIIDLFAQTVAAPETLHAPENHAWDGYVGATLGGVLGAIIAGFASFWAIRTQLFAERELRNREKAERQTAMLASLYHEVSVYWTSYSESIGCGFESDVKDELNFYHVSISDDVFSIYDSEAALLGTLSDFKLRNIIINAYLKLRSLRAIFSLHNTYVSEAISAQIANKSSSNPLLEETYQKRLDNLRKSSLVLRSAHSAAKDAVSIFLSKMRPYADPSQEAE